MRFCWACSHSLKHWLEVFENNLPFLGYFDWAKALADYDVIYAAVRPLPMLAANLLPSFRWVAICKSTAGEAMRSEGQCCGLSWTFLDGEQPTQLRHSRALDLLTGSIYLTQWIQIVIALVMVKLGRVGWPLGLALCPDFCAFGCRG